jgi:hypothetical protein
MILYGCWPAVGPVQSFISGLQELRQGKIVKQNPKTYHW